MSEIRVLIIDDAVAARRLVADAIAGDPELSVVGSAANGRIGLAMIGTLHPDVVVLDLEMPEMDGFEVLRALRRAHPRLPVFIFSVSARLGTPAALDALALGADDYMTKPSCQDGPDSASRMIAEQLAPRLKSLAASAGRASAGPQVPDSSPRSGEQAARAPEIVVIGVSTGGPEALGIFLPAIPADFPAPILIVQHMPPQFTGPLARRLDARSALAVVEAEDGQAVLPGQAVIAPGGRHLVARRLKDQVRVATHRGPPENSCRPSADVLFRSAAEAFGPGTLGVVMTGMGQDGLLGSAEIRRSGGRLLAQDEPSSVVWGMPGHVTRAGLADQVLPLDRLAAELVRLARVPWTPRGRP